MSHEGTERVPRSSGAGDWHRCLRWSRSLRGGSNSSHNYPAFCGQQRHERPRGWPLPSLWDTTKPLASPWASVLEGSQELGGQLYGTASACAAAATSSALAASLFWARLRDWLLFTVINNEQEAACRAAGAEAASALPLNSMWNHSLLALPPGAGVSPAKVIILIARFKYSRCWS